MTNPRYQVTGLPPVAARNLSAFMPHFNRLAASGAQQYKDGVSGYPGTRGIPANTRDTIPSPDPGDVVLYGPHASAWAPDMIWPNQYYVTPERDYRPGLLVQIYDPTQPWLTTMIPVPAVSLRQKWLRNSAAIAAGIDNQRGGAVKQPVSQLVAWAQRWAGNGLPSG